MQQTQKLLGCYQKSNAQLSGNQNQPSLTRSLSNQVLSIENFELSRLRTQNKQLLKDIQDLKKQSENNLDDQLEKQKVDVSRSKQELIKRKAQRDLDNQRSRNELKEMRTRIQCLVNDQRKVEAELKSKQRTANNQISNLKGRIEVMIRSQQMQAKNQEAQLSRLRRQRQTIQSNLQKAKASHRQELEANSKLRTEIGMLKITDSSNKEQLKKFQVQIQECQSLLAESQQQIISYRQAVGKLEAEVKAQSDKNLQLEFSIQTVIQDNEYLHETMQDVATHKISTDSQKTALTQTTNRTSFNQQSIGLSARTVPIQERDSLLETLEISLQQNNYLRLRMSQMIKQLTDKHSHEVESYRQKVLRLEYQIDQIRRIGKGQNQFDNILRIQLQQTQKFKEIVQGKNQQITTLHQTISQMKYQYRFLSNQLDILKVRMMFDTKNLQTQSAADTLHLSNEVIMMKRYMKTLQDRLNYTIMENKGKDEFMRQFILQRVGCIGEPREYIMSFFEHYQEMIQQLRPSRPVTFSSPPTYAD